MQNRTVSFQTTNIIGAEIQVIHFEFNCPIIINAYLHPAFLLFTCSCTLVFASCTIEVVPYSQDEFSGIKLILLVNLINIAKAIKIRDNICFISYIFISSVLSRIGSDGRGVAFDFQKKSVLSMSYSCRSAYQVCW